MERPRATIILVQQKERDKHTLQLEQMCIQLIKGDETKEVGNFANDESSAENSKARASFPTRDSPPGKSGSACLSPVERALS